jgi:Ca-activated chloride channel family protein
MTRRYVLAGLSATLLVVSFEARLPAGVAGPPAPQEPPAFKSGVTLVDITATVTDRTGHFVPGLQQSDFTVYEDNRPVRLAHFSAERVPVSLGLAVDTSGSMVGQKMQQARTALDRFVYELLDKDDEVFIYRFSTLPVLMQGWTTDRQLVRRALGLLEPKGTTALYDTVADAVAMATEGHNQKKAVVLITDGNDTASHTGLTALEDAIRRSEVLVYAIGIDGLAEQPQFLLGLSPAVPDDERVNVSKLRAMTDDSGGWTRVVRDARDLKPATAAIADELNQQYYLAYEAPGAKDGRWHSIRVEVKNPQYAVRARKGYLAN